MKVLGSLPGVEEFESGYKNKRAGKIGRNGQRVGCWKLILNVVSVVDDSQGHDHGSGRRRLHGGQDSWR